MRDPYRASRWRLVEALRAQGAAAKVVAAIMEVPRHLFVGSALALRAYEDVALPIGYGQTTSRPSTIAAMLSCVDWQGTERVLEIGAGCGYQTAVLAHLARRVYAVERIAPLAQRAEAALRALGVRNAYLKTADGALGWPERAPFDAIIVAAACTPQPAWLAQLREGGVLVFPRGEGDEAEVECWRKEEGDWRRVSLLRRAFVPLQRGTA